MFKSVFNRDNPRIYLGAVAVKPRTDFKMVFDQWRLFGWEDLETPMANRPRDFFELPIVQDSETYSDIDLGLDVIISAYQSGEFWGVDFGDMDFPLIWRPRIYLNARLYYLTSGKIKETFFVVEKLKWRFFVARIFTWRWIFRFRPLFDKEDMDYLLYRGCEQISAQIKEAI